MARLLFPSSSTSSTFSILILPAADLSAYFFISSLLAFQTFQFQLLSVPLKSDYNHQPAPLQLSSQSLLHPLPTIRLNTMASLRSRGDETYEQPSERGDELLGREILVCWKDATWYEAIIVKYCPISENHTIVYRVDDTIEIVSLTNLRWQLLAKKIRRNGKLMLDGATIDFRHPIDKTNYRAMVYDHSSVGHKIKIVYLTENSTDVLRGEGWNVVKLSPCVLEQQLSSSESEITKIALPTTTSNQAQNSDFSESETIPTKVPRCSYSQRRR